MKILIVEDNKDSSEILGLFVMKLGHQVIKASKQPSSHYIHGSRVPRFNFHGFGSAG
jgi:DNA-binding response OmpR family regulator